MSAEIFCGWLHWQGRLDGLAPPTKERLVAKPVVFDFLRAFGIGMQKELDGICP